MSAAHGARRTAHGERRTAHGARRTANGARITANGARITANGERRSAHGARRTAYGDRRGFTLLELLVVLALLAITAAAAVPAFLGDAFSTPEQRTASALAAVLAQTRDAARASGAPATLVLSPSDGRYWIATRDSTAAGVLALPSEITLRGPGADRFECRFSPAGSATPLVVTVHGARDVAVRVDGWSGNIGIGDGRAS